MAKEVLELEVKSDIKSVTKETKDWGKTLDNVNESLNIQNKVINDLERDLIKLKAQQDAIPKGAFYAGMADLNKKIKETSTELKLEKNALKDLTNQQKEANTEVKKFNTAQKETQKTSKDSISNFHFMGVSLNGIKRGFAQIIPTAKSMFGTIKAGLMSTGIGALVIAVFALMQSFKRSEAGQEKFQRIMAAIGAVTDQLLDAFADLGELIIKTFKDPLPAVKKFGNGIIKFILDPMGATRDIFIDAALASKKFVDETKKEVEVIDEVTKMRQKAHHIDRALKVERANANREINDLRLKAEDREKNSAAERIVLLRKAQKIEQDITDKEIKSKKLLIDAQILEMAQGKNSIQQKDKLAQLQADAINLDTKRLRGQRLLQTQITTAINEEIRLRKELAIEIEKMPKIADEANEEQIAGSKYLVKSTGKIFKGGTDNLIELKRMELAAMAQFSGALGALAGENKQLAAAEALINTYLAFSQVMRDRTILSTSLKLLTAGTVLATGLANVRNIIAVDVGAGGGGVSGGVGASAVAGSGTPAPQMMSGAFSLEGGQEVEPARAYVVSDDITANQNKLAIIRRRATI